MSDSDEDSIFDWTLKDAAQVSMEVSTGKLESVEGGVFGRSLGESGPCGD
jgi:hypothetical protein